MHRGLKSAIIRVMALVCAFALCALPALASAGDLYNARAMQALEAGRQVVETIKLELGEGFLPAEQAATIDALLDVIELEVAFAQLEDGSALDLAILVSGQKALTGTAYLNATGVDLETSALPGKTLFISYETLGAVVEEMGVTDELQLSEDLIAQLMEAFVPYGDTATEWANGLTSSFSEDQTPVPATESRNASASSVTFRLEPAQIKDLLAQLATLFSADTALQGMLYAPMGMTETDMADLAAALPMLVSTIEPGPSSIEITTYSDESGSLVGMEATMPQPFGSSGFFSRLVYDRLTNEASAQDQFKVAARWAEGGELEGRLILTSGEKQPSPIERLQSSQGNKVDFVPGISTSMSLMGKLTPGAGQSPIELQATNDRTVTGDDQQEKVDQEFAFMFYLPADGSLAADVQPEMAQLLTETTVSAGFTLNSVTKALAGDDFSDEALLQIKYGGNNVVNILVTTSTKAYQPSDTSANTVVNLLEMNEEESQALMEELNAGLTQALLVAMAYLPPELMAMFSGDFQQ